MKREAVFILGAGGHCKVIIDTLRFDESIEIQGILDTDPCLINTKILDIPVLGSEEDILKEYNPSDVKLINGVGSIGIDSQRVKIFHKLKSKGFQFLSAIHPSSNLGSEVTLGEGVQLMAGSTIQTDSHIGNNVIVNTHASIDHDCIIGDHVHLAPGAVCCGNVSIGAGTHIGCGAIILQGIKIANNSLIAAGAVVVKDINVSSKVVGIPARIME